MQGASPINYAKDILILPVDKLSRDTYTVILKNKRLTAFTLTYVTKFAKRGLIHASDFPNLMRHNFICKQAIRS